MIKTHINIYLIIAWFFYSGIAYAEDFNVRVTAGFWATEFTGFVSDTKTLQNSVNLKDDLALEKSIQTFFYFYIEQDNSIIPNVRIGRSKIKTSGSNVLTKTFNFGDTVYLVNEKIDSEFNLDQVEVALYWKVLNNDARLDLGLSVKDFSGELIVDGEVSGSSNSSLSETIPLIYTAFDIDLPLTEFIVGINVSFLKLSSASLSDILVFTRYKATENVGLELGYRDFQVRVNSSTVNTDIKVKGLYLNGYVYF